MWSLLLAPYGVLAIFAPQWSILWGLGINLLALGVLCLIPGSVLPSTRGPLTAAILAATVFHAVLSFTVWSQGMVFFTAIGLLAVAMGTLLFSRVARPWEIRRAQRSAGRLIILTGIILIILGLIIPRISMTNISAHRPLVSVWETLSNHAETMALYSKRVLLGERAKTNALSELESQLQQAHKARWQRAVQQISDVPLTTRELQELGIKDP